MPTKHNLALNLQFIAEDERDMLRKLRERLKEWDDAADRQVWEIALSVEQSVMNTQGQVALWSVEARCQRSFV